MASQELLAALDKLGITDANSRTAITSQYTTVGVRPAELVTHTERRTYFMTGITP